MKTKDLIKKLQETDPSGELEVVADGSPIYFLETYPAYYDGSLAILIEDPKKKPYHSIIGMKFTNKGRKVRLHTMDMESVFLDDKNAILDVSEVNKNSAKRLTKYADELRDDEDIKIKNQENKTGVWSGAWTEEMDHDAWDK